MSEVDNIVEDDKIVKKTAVKKPVKVQDDEPIERISNNGSVLFMTSGGGSWTTPNGVTFSKERPYQLVGNDEVEALLTSGRFRRAEPQEVKDFYKIEL